jgi:hypothetical protein
MDRFTRNYLIILGSIAAIIIIAWLATLSPRVWELNGLLEDDPQLSAYPYRFEVLSLDNGVATLTTPRSPQVPAVRFLGILYPQLANRRDNDPDVIAAQKELAEHQGRAKELILAQPDVDRVQWQIDTAWYAEHGVVLQ